MAPDIFESIIKGTINADEIYIGKGVIVEEGVLITGKTGKAKKVALGDFCYIGRDVKIFAPEFKLGDYSKLNAFSYAHGEKPLQIGRNCWIGGNVVLDSMGGLDIDDNVGIGAQSQLWTHIQFGDIVEGCRFYSNKYMYIGKDAWFVGHCIVSPVRVGEKSMAMVGSLIVKDMLPNCVYAGVPAKNVTDQLGKQFEERSVDQKAAKLQEIIAAFVEKNPKHKGKLVVIKSMTERREDACCFDVSSRTYTKTYSQAEVDFFKARVPLIKFTPYGEAPFITPQQAVRPFSEDIS